MKAKQTYISLAALLLTISFSVALSSYTRRARLNYFRRLQINQPYINPNLAIQLTYPEDWQVEAREKGIKIKQPNLFLSRGIVVSLDIFSADDLKEGGLTTKTDLAPILDIFNLSKDTIHSASYSDTRLFGEPANRVYASQEGGFTVDFVQGSLGNQIVYFVATAPTETLMQSFLPGWEDMLESTKKLN